MEHPNNSELPEREFEVEVYLTLKKKVSIFTDKYEVDTDIDEDDNKFDVYSLCDITYEDIKKDNILPHEIHIELNEAKQKFGKVHIPQIFIDSISGWELDDVDLEY